MLGFKCLRIRGMAWSKSDTLAPVRMKPCGCPKASAAIWILVDRLEGERATAWAPQPCTRTAVLSSIKNSWSVSWLSASNTAAHSPLTVQVLKYEYTVFQDPTLWGKNLQPAPPLSTQRKASTRKRSSPQRRPPLRAPLNPSRKVLSFFLDPPKAHRLIKILHALAQHLTTQTLHKKQDHNLALYFQGTP